MELKGWDYTGRNIGPEFHRQFRMIIYYLMLPDFVRERKWGNVLQEELATKIGMSSAGVVRTVKKVSENLGLINRVCFSSRGELKADELLTERGLLFYNAATLENQVVNDPSIDNATKKRVELQIKTLYEEAYCDAVMNYYFTNSDGSHLCPLRATLKALQKYSKLDKWEWYMLNTFVRHDDDPVEEKNLETNIKKYRDGDYAFTMKSVVEKPKGHQYTPQHFEFAGLLYVVQRPSWFMTSSDRHNDIKEKVLSDYYLENLYKNSGGNA